MVLISSGKILVKKYRKNKSLHGFFGTLGLNWYMITVWAAHSGNLWKASAKSMKMLLKKTFGTIAKLFLHEIYKIICQIESICISGPLASLSNDSTDLQPLHYSILIKSF